MESFEHPASTEALVGTELHALEKELETLGHERGAEPMPQIKAAARIEAGMAAFKALEDDTAR